MASNVTTEEVQSHWIGGKAVASEGGAWIETVDPSTGKAIAKVPLGTTADVDRAVVDGRRAQREWAATGVHARSSLLHRLAEVVRAHREELAHLDALDSGNPIVEMRKDVDYGAGALAVLRGASAWRFTARRSRRAPATSTTRSTSPSA